MKNVSHHTFHIPVMGLAFTIDTPLKVARFGISSAVSIMSDELLEQMRIFYSKKYVEDYSAIPDGDHQRTERITAYLDLMKRIVDRQVEKIRKEEFGKGNEIDKYFRLLPDESPLKIEFQEMQNLSGESKIVAQNNLRKKITAGSIDVNVMTKVDKNNYNKSGALLPMEFSDALSALRGFAESQLESSVIFSAGMNPRLYSYLECFSDFYPNEKGELKKKVIIKVSDFRSAAIQGKYLAKKGIWVSEYRIESGLNCGGHAFATDGLLLGPILEEFKQNKKNLAEELFELCNQSLSQKDRHPLMADKANFRLTVQGGIGTKNEDRFLRLHYGLDGTGWGSPFLLVPEATTLDYATLKDLSEAEPEDYYLSEASPLGVPFHNYRKSSGENQRKQRIEKNRPGSPCYKKYLSFNTEFTDLPICTGSREYQHKKLKEIELREDLSLEEKREKKASIIAKDCLCEGLASSALLVNEVQDPHKLTAVTVCPGPNLAYFSQIISLEQMVDFIYGKISGLHSRYRPHIFVNELKLYIDYFSKEIERNMSTISDRKIKYFEQFKHQLIKGIDYYEHLLPNIIDESESFKTKIQEELRRMRKGLVGDLRLEVGG